MSDEGVTRKARLVVAEVPGTNGAGRSKVLGTVEITVPENVLAAAYVAEFVYARVNRAYTKLELAQAAATKLAADARRLHRAAREALMGLAGINWVDAAEEAAELAFSGKIPASVQAAVQRLGTDLPLTTAEAADIGRLIERLRERSMTALAELIEGRAEDVGTAKPWTIDDF